VPRSDSALRRTGWVIWSAQVLVLVASTTVEAAVPSAGDGLGVIVQALFFLTLSISFSTVGALVLRRKPRNRLAWFMILVTGNAVAVPMLFQAWATLGLQSTPESLPGAAAASALDQGSWVLAIGTIAIFLVLLFPDGRLPSRRWRWLAWAGAVDIIAIAAAIAMIPGKMTDGPGEGIANPLGVESAKPAIEIVFFTSIFALPLLIVAAAVAMVLRFRRSQGTERLQLKWFASAAAFVALSYLVTMLAQFAKPTPFDGPDPQWLQVLQDFAQTSFIALPIAIGIAILRHRLYDIDVVIKRTVVYGSLSLSLAGIYLGVVLTLQALTDPVTGGSDLAVATSTLVVAALFRPLRRRIQTGVDRRFFRRAYDASLTLESFTDRLRHEVTLDAVSADLRDVVDETMQPAHLSLWLRAQGGRT
jgi:MFS family permease